MLKAGARETGPGESDLYLIQLLLPSYEAPGRRFDDQLFARTRAELIDRFGGVTAYLRSPASGAWIAPEGHVERDDVLMIEVLAEQLDREWWRAYLATLKARFAQAEIHARALPAEKLE